MASAICIITSTGMKCLSSPLKEHHPAPHPCKAAPPDPARTAKVALIRKHLKDPDLALSRARRDVIARVVELMLAAGVDDGSRFTIVKAR